MIAYRSQRRRIRTSDALRRVESATGFERLMEVGETEAGITDALCPEHDDLSGAGFTLRGALAPQQLPEWIDVSVPEGFAYYALDPGLYRISARRYFKDRRPSRVAVIGLRSIGTTLGAVVEQELSASGCDTRFWTVRPRGHPWDRVLRVAADLEQAWREWDGDFAIVDEGPGLSGSSFACAAEFLSGIGVAGSRIVFFPSWVPSGDAFISEKARVRWRRHRKYSAAFEELRLFDGARDLSGGAWRSLCGQWPVVQPQHERRKYLWRDRLYKFAGYGPYGCAKLERARVLAEFTTPACGLERGFLMTGWVDARPASLCPGLIDFAADYMAFLRRNFPTEESPAFDSLAEMIAFNVPHAPDVSRWRAAVADSAAIALDGRMLRHEWLETEAGYRKADALEHHDDHFFPGPQDAAWDLAAFAIEFGLDAAGEARLRERYACLSGDRGVEARLPFYRLAWLAFRLGYCHLAHQALGDSGEGARFRRLRARYAARLEREICHG